MLLPALRSPRPGRSARTAAGVLTGAAVLTQVAHPLLRGPRLHRTTVASVAAFSAAALVDAARRGGPRGAGAALGAAGGLGLLAEVVGTRTGWPFGRYRYAGTLGPQVLDVPVAVPLAWTMLAAPALQLGRHVARDVRGPAHHVAVVGTAAWTLASWDLFLDPQMTGEGHWEFTHPHPHLPGVPGTPLVNYAGWLLTALAVCGALHAVSPPDRGVATQRVPAALLGWTWLGSTLANAVFFHRPAVAAWGGLGMGLTVGPYLRSLRTRR